MLSDNWGKAELSLQSKSIFAFHWHTLPTFEVKLSKSVSLFCNRSQTVSLVRNQRDVAEKTNALFPVIEQSSASSSSAEYAVRWTLGLLFISTKKKKKEHLK